MANDMRLLNLGKYRFLAYTGKISYGLYCFHGVIITFWTLVIAKLSFYVSPLIGSFLILFITFFVAHLSYQFIEKPFLNLKNKFV
jgi:peptidoglycan/LPS O-acetylase OafA/YrhL